MTAELSVVAVAETRPDSIPQAEAAIAPCITMTRKEPGCLAYDVHRDSGRQGRYVFLECWTNVEALDQHKQTPHFNRMVEALTPYLDKPLEIYLLNTLLEPKAADAIA